MLLISYQFLEDAYKNHKHHMETMTHQLQEKKKLIEEVSNSIDTAYVFQSFQSVFNLSLNLLNVKHFTSLSSS